MGNELVSTEPRIFQGLKRSAGASSLLNPKRKTVAHNVAKGVWLCVCVCVFVADNRHRT